MAQPRIAILAGGGSLPLELAAALRASGADPAIICIRGFADRATRSASATTIDIVDVKGLLEALERLRCSSVVLAGTVSRPSGAVALGVFAALRNRAELAIILKPLLEQGDDGLLRGVASYLEGKGYTVLGSGELAPQLFAAAGRMGSVEIGREEADAIETGRRTLAALSPFDIGQAVVVRGRRVIAIEGPEGTDRMLKRVRAIGRRSMFRPPETGGVLVKMPKIGQDLRLDLPAIGPRTIARASAAGLAGIAVAAGQTLVLDRRATIAAADRAGLFLVGIAPWSEPQP